MEACLQGTVQFPVAGSRRHDMTHDLRQRLPCMLRPGPKAASGREADRVVLTRAHACTEPAADRPVDQPAGRSALAALCRHPARRATGVVGPHGFLGLDRVDPAAATGHLLVQLADPRCPTSLRVRPAGIRLRGTAGTQLLLPLLDLWQAAAAAGLIGGVGAVDQ